MSQNMDKKDWAIIGLVISVFSYMVSYFCKYLALEEKKATVREEVTALMYKKLELAQEGIFLEQSKKKPIEPETTPVQVPTYSPSSTGIVISTSSNFGFVVITPPQI